MLEVGLVAGEPVFAFYVEDLPNARRRRLQGSLPKGLASTFPDNSCFIKRPTNSATACSSHEVRDSAGGTNGNDHIQAYR